MIGLMTNRALKEIRVHYCSEIRILVDCRLGLIKICEYIFVTDLLFLEGIPALFKTALCLLSFHKNNLLKEVGFENIISYLKNSLLKMEKQEMVHIINEV